MIDHTQIQTPDSAVSPPDGLLNSKPSGQMNPCIAATLGGDSREIRKKVAKIAEQFIKLPPLEAGKLLIEALEAQGEITAEEALSLLAETKAGCRCYAAQLCEFRHGKKGWPDAFDRPMIFPGRMAKTARHKDMMGQVREDKPWLSGQPWLVFISDMGDALSVEITFEYLLKEIIYNVISEKGRRHVWLWVTKRPRRMAEFARWLKERGIPWPDNLVPMTTVTSMDTAYRVAELREVPSKMRGLSIEPLWGETTLDLAGIDWVIVGGESGSSAKPFHIEWALNLHVQCQTAGVAFFFKQLGAKSLYQGQPIELNDPHGGEWDEWPDGAWKVREVPDFSKLVGTPRVVEAGALAPADMDYRITRERVVETAISATIEAAKALKEIKDYKDGLLWKTEFKTFEAYCREKWGYQKSHAYRLVESGDFVAQLEAYNRDHSPRGGITLPVNESQIRAIAAVPKENRVAAWVAGIGNEAVDTLTGKAIAEKIKDYLPPKVVRGRAAVVAEAPPVVPVMEPINPEEVLATFEARVGAHPKVAEIRTLIVQIKGLLSSPSEQATVLTAA